ncbi:MAG: type II toxin-antitoxin system prevent-host-death family antitoxin, partial [Actinobacteria bacterium]|nr:type II toxin-antitoxin system prevent-host-death family antitoxin [Actinomycetota bacterium]
MMSVGVRELRQRASELLRLVEAGETIEVTDRGRPVAVLAPLPDQGPIDRLQASGDLIRARHDLDELPDP